MSRCALALVGLSWAAPSLGQTLLEVDQARANFGHSVAIAGDVDGDGYDDVLVGAPLYDNGETNEGAAYLFLGSAAGIATTPAWSIEGNQAQARLGTSVAAAGDVNGDGFADVIIGVPRLTGTLASEGAAWVFLGSAAGLAPTPDWQAAGNQGGALSGTSVACAGDVNADGYSDVIIGAPLFDMPLVNQGKASVFLGGPTGLAAGSAWRAYGGQPGVNFGTSVASAGDADGDGYDDVVVGAPEFSAGEAFEGRVSLYRGGAAGVSPLRLSRESNQLGARFGSTVAPAYNVNGDGYDDVLIGARLYSNGEIYEGRAYLFFGSAPGLGAPPPLVRESDQAYAYLGVGLAGAGDVDGDGIDDILVGVPNLDAGEIDEGRAMVLLGGSGAVWAVIDGEQVGAELGYAVAGGGDVNGDGFDDVVIGARKYDSGQSDEGVAFVYLGG